MGVQSRRPSESEYLQTDVLVIGCGIAGGITALELASKGVSVVLVTLAASPEQTNTFYAQGGVVVTGVPVYQTVSTGLCRRRMRGYPLWW